MGIMDVVEYFSLFVLLCINFNENSCQPSSSTNLQNAGPRSSTTFRGLFSRMADQRLSAIVSTVVTNSSVEDCAQRCVQETIYQCKSFDFDNGQRDCLMFSVSVNDPDVHLISSAGRDHYQTAYSKLLFNRLPNHMLTTTHNRRILQTSVEECARRCVHEYQFKCRGFDYEVLSETCWLTELTPEQAYGINVMDGWDYYERNPEGPLDRFVNYGFGHMRPLPGSTIYEREYRGVSLENCATLCLAAKDFHCLSFDYNFIVGNQQSTCHLSQFIAANVYGLAASPTKRTLHFERKEKFLSYFYATPYAVVLGNNHKQYTRVTPNRCAQYCMEEDAFVCRSFDYKIRDGTCILSSKTGSDVGGLYNQGLQEVHHFEMKPMLDCGGTLTDPKGGFASPNWPRNYAHHENCVWNITVHQYKVIKLRFTHLDLGLSHHDPCSEREDRVAIKWTDNWTGEARSVCVVANTKEIHANSNTALVSFVTNSQLDSQGFRVFYSEEWPCDAFLSKAPGEFASPDYPNNYPTSARCSWRLTAPEGSRVRVHFTEFKMEQNALNHCNDKFDHVIILDGGTVNAARIGLYCGTHGPFTVRSSGRDMFIQFRSDVSHSLPGFHATYDFEPQGSKGGSYVGEDGLDLDNADSDYNDVDAKAGLEGKTAKSTSDAEQSSSGYKAAMWAVVSTLLVLLIVVGIILFIVWKRHKGHLGGAEEVRDGSRTEHDAPELAYADCLPLVNSFRNRFQVFWKRGEPDVIVTPEEVPLQEPTPPMKQNNVIDLTKPTPSKRSFSNMLYEEPCTQQNNLNWKTVNLDSKT